MKDTVYFKFSRALPYLLMVLSLGGNQLFAQSMSVDRLVEQWMSLEQQRSELLSTWEVRQTILQQQSQILDDEQASLRKVIKANDSLQGRVEKKRFELLKQQTQAESSQAYLGEQLAVFESRFIDVLQQLPPPVQQQWQKALAKLDTNTASNSERLERVLNMFNQLNEFESRIALHTDVLLMNDNKKVQVQQVYLGLSQGWYVSADNHYYAYGYATPQGWQWLQNEDASLLFNRLLDASHIRELIDILEDPSKARFIDLPLKLARFNVNNKEVQP